jgi:hypothetical protein
MLGPQNPLNQEESEVNAQEHLPMETTEITQIEAILEGLLDQDHQVNRHKDLIRDIQQESLKENGPKIPPWKFLEKAPKITKKEKREEHNQALRNHAESSIHNMKGSYKV